MPTDLQTCYRHPDRRAGVTCQRCDRPICPSCMQQASVGFHCPECSRGGRQRVYTARTLQMGNRPIATQVLIAINVAVFIAGLSGGSGGIGTDSVSRFQDDYGLVGSLPGIRNLGVAHGEWYRLITGGFLHAGLLHIGFNMFALWVLGVQLERVMGWLRFSVVYMVSLLTGSLGVMILSPHDITVGASGAIFGLFGFALAYQLGHRIDIMQSGLGPVLLINLALTFGISGISIGGHIGGLAGGFLCGLVVYKLGPQLRNEALVNVLCGAIGVLAFIGGLVAASAFV
jgi:membrane associated rhomboid family serine protease